MQKNFYHLLPELFSQGYLLNSLPMVRPVISIDKIIFGYRIANNAKYEIAEVIQKLTADYKKKPDIVNSRMQEQF